MVDEPDTTAHELVGAPETIEANRRPETINDT
jgi:hypothetical protein